MRKRRFVIRTIKNGQVKINGRIFKPSSKWLEYDGRLDGKRYAFGLYWTGDKLESFVELWGTEEAYWAVSKHDECYKTTHPFPPEVVYNKGLWCYPWAAWYTESI